MNSVSNFFQQAIQWIVLLPFVLKLMKRHSQKFLIIHYAVARKDNVRDCTGITIFTQHSQFVSLPFLKEGSSPALPFYICRCALLQKGSVFFMTRETRGKTPQLFFHLCLAPCFPLHIDSFAFWLCSSLFTHTWRHRCPGRPTITWAALKEQWPAGRGR